MINKQNRNSAPYKIVMPNVGLPGGTKSSPYIIITESGAPSDLQMQVSIPELCKGQNLTEGSNSSKLLYISDKLGKSTQS